VTHVFRIETNVTLDGGGRLDDDEITDMIAMVIDELDQSTTEPSVGTERVGSDLQIVVEVTVDVDEEFDALTFGLAAIKNAFSTAGVGTAGVTAPRDLRSRVLPLQAA
jgi:hypothetical protein